MRAVGQSIRFQFVPGQQLTDSRLLGFAERLQSVNTHDELLDAVVAEIRESVGYNTAWIGIVVPEHQTFKIHSQQGPGVESAWDAAQEVPIDGDPYIERLVETGEIQIVEDAQTDPDVNREIVEQLGNRTVINVPMKLIDSTFGCVGLGTFGDEGPRLPTDAELEYLQLLANQTVLASARILLADKREEALRQAAETERVLARRQRLESMGELAAGVAHDFANQLSVIQASAELLRDQVSDEPASENVGMIQRAAAGASELAHQLLALGKQQDLAVAPVDIGERIVASAEMLDRVVGRSIEVRTEIAGVLPKVLADSAQIDQVLVNLGLNARDSMPDGGTLSISGRRDRINRDYVIAHPWAKLGEYVLIAVTDTGEGMMPETIERIFEPFFTTKASSDGTGLGLAVSRGIVEQHGGLIHAESVLGEGSTFSVYLPAIVD